MTTIRTVLKDKGFDFKKGTIGYWACKRGTSVGEFMGTLSKLNNIIDIDFPIKDCVCSAVLAESSGNKAISINTETGQSF